MDYVEKSLPSLYENTTCDLPANVRQNIWNKYGFIHHKNTTEVEQRVLPKSNEVGIVFVLRHPSLKYYYELQKYLLTSQLTYIWAPSYDI